MTVPLMISSKDDDLVGVARRSDPLGLLAVWSARAREAVPHLTEQTTEVRGFQILVEAFRLWSIFVNREPQPPERLTQFFMLVEQAFARTVGCRDGDWPLPGARRVRSRLGEVPRISVADGGWHLLGGQLVNGIWGSTEERPDGRGCWTTTWLGYPTTLWRRRPQLPACVTPLLNGSSD